MDTALDFGFFKSVIEFRQLRKCTGMWSIPWSKSGQAKPRQICYTQYFGNSVKIIKISCTDILFTKACLCGIAESCNAACCNS